MFRVLNKSRIPSFLHKKSNHIFTIWQHIVLLVLRQYEGKSYRMFVEWLIEAYYLRTSIQLSHIPHYTTLQKFAATISGTVLGRIISSFTLLLSNIRRLFISIDSSGFKVSIQCFTILYRQSKPTQEISKIINWGRGIISDSMFYQDKESSNKTRYHRLSANCRKNIRNPSSHCQ
jgi:hypothetical protein